MKTSVHPLRMVILIFNGHRPLSPWRFTWASLMLLISCNLSTEVTENPSNDKFIYVVHDEASLPAAVKGVHSDPDTLLPPTVVPLKKPPITFSAHPNIRPLIPPKRQAIPKQQRSITLGKDGVPFPRKIAAKKQIVIAHQPKPIPASEMRRRDNFIYDIKYLSDGEGLEHLGICHMLEDKRGHLWFSTITGGVYRYDGENFFHYSGEEGLPGDYGCWSIMEDSKGNIWFGGREGVCYYDGQHFNRLSEDAGINNSRVGSLTEDSKGNIWFSYGDLFCFDGTNFTIYEREDILGNDLENEGHGNNPINDLIEDSQGNIWIATYGDGVIKFDGRSMTQYTMDDGLVDNYIFKIFEDRDGQIWFGSGGLGVSPGQGKGLSRFTPGTSIDSDGFFTNFDQASGFTGRRINDIMQDTNGDLWFATYASGIIHFDGQQFTSYTQDEGLLMDAVLCLIEDQKGNIWAGTNGFGVICLRPGGFHHFSEDQGLPRNWVNNVFEDAEGNIWMGLGYGGVVKYDGENFTNYSEEQGLIQDWINAITADRLGNMWFASRNNGICRFDGQNFTNYSIDQGLKYPFCWDIHVDHQGFIWIANAHAGGLNRLDPKTGVFTNYFDPTNGLGTGRIIEDRQQNLWFGTEGYLAKYNPDQDQVEYIYHVTDSINGFVDHFIQDDLGNVWTGTATSLIQIRKEGVDLRDSFPQLLCGRELPEMEILSAIYDTDDNLWLGTANRGLKVFEGGLKNIMKSDFRWFEFGKPDGLRDKKMSYTALLDHRHRMWWGTQAGATTLDLNQYHLPIAPPTDLGIGEIEIRQKFIDFRMIADSAQYAATGQSFELQGAFDSVVSFKNYPAKMDLPYNQNHLTFHFSALDSDAPAQIRYSYYMDDIDQAWSPPTINSQADYRNLPHGTHTFSVKAIGQSKIWSDPYDYTFTINPPWWYSWWAYCLYTLMLMGGIGGYIYSLRRKVRKKQEQLEIEQYLNRELRDLNLATSRFVPKDFLTILNKESLKELKLGDQTDVQMTVLFSDIRDYTRLSENMSPEANFQFINEYLGLMGPIIKKNEGFICQYYGDGIMALFKEGPDKAIKTAIEMHKSLIVYNKKRINFGEDAVRIGIGINTGRLMLGVIGDEQRYDAAVISDAVNTASRLEGLTKTFGSQIIISEKTLNQLLDDITEENPMELNYRFLGKVRVKGREKELKIYECYNGESEKVYFQKNDTKSIFEEAIMLYFDQKFGKAADLFKVILEDNPGDVATKYYLDRCIQYVLNGVDKSWSGVEEMVSK